MKIIINGEQIWPTEKSPKLVAFHSEADPDDGTLTYTEHALDSNGSPVGDPTIIIEMHPKQVQSICFAAQKLDDQEEKHGAKLRKIAGSALRKLDEVK